MRCKKHRSRLLAMRCAQRRATRWLANFGAWVA